LTSSATLSASRSTATLTARCPAKTAFSLGLSTGAHASGNQRQVCNNAGQCLRYGLWQDASATQSWGDHSSGNTMNVSNEQGGTQSYSIYGVVPAQPLTGTGEFSDDVVVTLTY
ncbi:spore coat protein, partial [Enterobacter sp. 63]